MPEDAEPPVFLVGLTMAGAVSAGAYTAGVLDYLVRALDAHNARVRRGPTGDDPDPPRHLVVIKVLTGASAGGVCAGLGVAGLIGRRTLGDPTGAPAGDGAGARLADPLAKPYPTATGPATCACALAPLYDVWVDGLTLWDGTTGLLATADLDGDTKLIGADFLPDRAARPLAAAFDSTHLDDAARAALEAIPAWDGDRGYDFLARDLDVFLTTTDLRGLPYKLDFANNQSHTIAQHSVVRHFRVEGLGATPHPSPWLARWRDRGITLDPAARDAAGHVPFMDESSPWHAFTVSAIASGAFPLGLAPRRIAATPSQLGHVPGASWAQGGAMPIDLDPDALDMVAPWFGPDGAALTATPYVAVDGGMINNEPFEYARFTLRAQRGGQLVANERAPDQADRAVIMIDPFPEGPAYTPLDRDGAVQLASLIPSLLRLAPALVQQSRFKMAELVQAARPAVRSRFLIAPKRSADASRADPDADEAITGADAIACGALGGFSGFVARDFRLHDYVLGQRNCQRFLARRFVLDCDNDVLAPDQAARDRAAAARTAGTPVPQVAIVQRGPDAEVLEPLWPALPPGAFRPIMAQASVRLGRIGPRLFSIRDLGLFGRFGLTRLWNGVLPWSTGIKGDILAAIHRALVTAFVLRGQHAALNAHPPGIRHAYAALVQAGGTAQTAVDLATAVRRQADRGTLPPGVAVPTPAQVAAAMATLTARGLVRRPTTNVFGTPRYLAILA